MKHRPGKDLDDKLSNKQSLYLDVDVAAEMRAEAHRLDRSMSWIAHRAWAIARREIMGAPTEDLGPTPPNPKPTPPRPPTLPPAPPSPSPDPLASPGASQASPPPKTDRLDAFLERYRVDAQPSPSEASPWGDAVTPDPKPEAVQPTRRRFGVF
jgi:uncharacterized small protein (TIGR04563 family)